MRTVYPSTHLYKGTANAVGRQPPQLQLLTATDTHMHLLVVCQRLLFHGTSQCLQRFHLSFCPTVVLQTHSVSPSLVRKCAHADTVTCGTCRNSRYAAVIGPGTRTGMLSVLQG